MSNYNTIYDPITGKELDNVGNKRPTQQNKQQGPIDPFTGGPLSTVGSTRTNPLHGSSGGYRQAMDEKDFDTLPFVNVESENLFDDRANLQSGGEQLWNGIMKAGFTFGGALVDNTVGFFVGGLTAAMTGSLSGFHDNILGRAIDDVNNWAQENYPSYYTEAQQETINPLTMNFWADKVLNGFAYSAAAMTSMALPGMGGTKALVGLSRQLAKNRIKKSAHETSKILFKGDAQGVVRLADQTKRGLFAAHAEAGVEARETGNELRESLIDGRKLQIARENGIEEDEFGNIDTSNIRLSQDDFDDIEKYKNAAGNANYGMNLIIVGGSQALIFPKLMRGNTESAYKELRKRITKDGKTFIPKPKTKLNTAKTIAKDSGFEAIQEGSQHASSFTFQDYYTNEYLSDGGGNLIESFTDGLADTFGTTEGLESMLIGAIVGGGMTGLKSLGSTKSRDERINKLTEVLNSESFKELAKDYRGFERTLASHKLMMEAVENNDEEGFHKHFNNMFMSAVYEEARQGTGEVLIDKLNEAKKMSPEEFKKFFDMEDMEGEIDPVKMADEAIASVQKGIDTYNNLEFLFEDKERSIISIASKVFGKDKTTTEEQEMTKDILKLIAYEQLTEFDYLRDRETSLAEEIRESSEGLIDYLENANDIGGEYFRATKEQLEEYKEKVFKDAYYKNKPLQKKLRAAIARSNKAAGENARFKSTKDFRERMFKNNSDLTQKQKELVEALEKVQQASWLRADKKLQLEKKLEQLQNLAFERALGNEVYNRLAEIDNPSVSDALAKRVKASIEERLKATKERIKQEAAEAKTKEEQDKAKAKAKVNDDEAAYSEDFDDVGIDDEGNPKPPSDAPSDAAKPKSNKTPPSTADEVDEIINDNTIKDKNNAEDVDTSDLSAFLYYRFQQNPRLEVKEMPDITQIIEENGNEMQPMDKKNEMKFYQELQALQKNKPNSKTILAIAAYYDAINKGKPKEPVHVYKQPVPNTEEQGQSNESEPKETPKEVKNAKEAIPEDQSFIVTPTQEYWTEGYPTVFDENISKINNPEFAPKGTKLYLEILDSEYSRKNPKRPQILVYAEDNNGVKIPIGLWGGNKSKLTDSVFKEVTENYKIGDKNIDIGLQVEDRWAGNLNSTKEYKSLSEIENHGDAPILAVALESEGKTKLHTNLVTQPIIAHGQLRKGHTYMLIPTTKKTEDGETIYYPAHVVTSKVGRLEQSVKDRIKKKVRDLLLSATKDAKTKNITNYAEINDEIFLNFDIKGDTIEIESPQGEGNETIKFSFDKNSKEDLAELDKFLDNAVVRIDYKKINVGRYNSKLDSDGKTKIDLNPLTPIYNTAFIASRTSTPTETKPDPKNQTTAEKTGAKNPQDRNNTSDSNKAAPKKPVSLKDKKGNTGEVEDIFSALNSEKEDTSTKTDIETQEDKLERRRQEKLKNSDITIEDRGDNYYSLVETKGSVISFEERESLIGKKVNFIVKNPNNNKLTDNYRGTIIKHESAGIAGDLRIVLELDNGQVFSIDRSGNFYTQAHVRFTEKIPSIVTEINAEYDAEIDALKGTPKARKQTAKFKKSDSESELEYLQRILPNTPVSVLEDLASVAKQGKNAWGLFLRGAIFLQKGFSKGTAYHEAFHAVFNSLMSESERIAILTEAQALYGTYSIEEHNELKEMYPDLNDSQLEDIWLEEQLAEDFRRHVQKLKDKSIKGRIRNFFRKLLKLLNIVTTTPYIENVFENIDNGVYGKRPVNHRFRAEPLFRQKRIPGLESARETRDVIETVDTLFKAFVNNKAKKDGTSFIQAIVDATPKEIYENIYMMFEKTYDNAVEQNDKETEIMMANIMNSFLTIDETGEVQLDLIPQLHQDEFRRNERLNLKTLQEQAEIMEGLDISEISDEELEPWQKASIERNGKDKLSLKLKRIIKDLKTENINSIGVPKSVSFDSTYNVLEDKLSGIFDSEVFFKKLDNLAILYPEFNQLIRELDKSPTVKASFFHHFAKGKNEYAFVKIENKKDKKTGQVNVLTSIVNLSKVNTTKEVITNLESAMLVSPLFDGNKIVLSHAKKLFELYEKELTRLRGIKEYEEKDFKRLSDILDRYSIKLSPGDLLKQVEAMGKKPFLSNISTLESKAGYVFKKLSQNKNPFSEETTHMSKPFDALADLITSGKEQYLQNSIMNSENKMQYANVVPNHIHKTIAKLNDDTKNFVEFFESDPSYSNHLLLEQAKSGTRKFRVIVGDGFDNKIEYKNSRRKNYSLQSYDIVNLAMYFNQGNNDAFYSFPELSDSPIQMFMQNQKFNREEGLRELYNLFLFERNRIETNVKVKNYTTNEFVYFPFLNKAKKSDLQDEKFVMDEIEKYFVGENSPSFSKFLKDLKDNKIISENEKGELVSNFIDSRVTSSNKYNSLTDFLQEYHINYAVMNGNITTLFSGDPAFAKVENGSRTTDLNKRAKEIISPAAPLDVAITGPKFSMYIVEDETIDLTKNSIYSAVEKLAADDNRLQLFAKAVENTDGQTIISLERYRKIKRAQDEWTPEMEAMYPALLAGTESPSQTLFMAQAIKGFYFGLTKDSSGKVIPTQKKDSEIVLLKSMTKDNPKLQDLYDRLNSEGKYKNSAKIEGVTFASTIKKGERSVQKLEDEDKYSNDENIVEFNYENFGIQQPTPPKHLDTVINFGTQFRKLILANLTESYTISGIEGPVKAIDVKNLMHSIIHKNLQEDYDNLYNSISSNGELDYAKLRDVLIRELENGDFPLDHLEALELTQDGFRLDLWNPKHAHRIESLLNSLIKNKVSRQTINGASLVNASDYVVKNDNSLELRMNADGTAIEYMEAKLPWWSKDMFDFYADENGVIDMDRIAKENPELLDAVGYRVPTEHKYSMVKIKVVGFTNQSAGGNIYLPVEAIKLTGLDFDIDKMFFILPSFKTNYSKSTYKKAFEFLENLNISRQAILEEYASFSDVVSANEEYLNSLSFRELKRNFIQDILFSNTIENNHYKEAYLKEYGINEIESLEYLKPDFQNITENSRKQRDNGLLEIAKSILSSPQTFDEQSKPGDFSELVAIRDEFVKYNGITSDMSNPILASVQRELFQKTSDAGVLIGVFADNTSSHSMLQYESITVSNQFTTLGKKITQLDATNDKETAKSLSILGSAAVDAVKDPVFHELNITRFTGNILATMLRTGIPMKDALSLLNNKIIIEASRRISNLDFANPKEVREIIADLKADVKNHKLATKKDIDIKTSKSDSANDRLLNTFSKFYSLSLEVQKITKATKVDATPPGSLMAHNEVYMRAVGELRHGGIELFDGTSSIFDETSNYRMIQDFYNYTYIKPTKEILSKLFPWNNKNFIRVKSKLQSLYTTPLTAQQLNHINNSLMTYILSGNEFFNFDLDAMRYFSSNEFFDKVLKAKKSKDENIFLKALTVDKAEKTITFRNTTSLSSEKIEELQDHWQDLLDGDEESRALGEDLFKFNFISNGFIFSSKSFYHIAPLSLYEESIQKNRDNINIQLEYGDFLSTFVEQYLRQEANFDKLNLPKIDPKGDNVTKTNVRNIIEAKEELGDFDMDTKAYIFPEYLKESKSKMLFRRIGNMYDNRYSPVPLLGSENRVEYVFGNIEPNTRYENNVLKLGDVDIRRGSQYLNQLSIQKGLTYDVEGYYWYAREDDGFRVEPPVQVHIRTESIEGTETIESAQQSNNTGKEVVQDLSGNTYSVNESDIITYETESGPIRYITDENGDMVMLSDKNTDAVEDRITPQQEITETETSQLDMFEESKLEQEIAKPYKQVKTNNNIAISKLMSPEEWNKASEEEKKNILKCN